MRLQKYTESELIENVNMQLFQLDMAVINHEYEKENILDQIPSGVQINSYDGKCRHMNIFTQQYLGISSEELKVVGPKYRKLNIFLPEEADVIFPKIVQFQEKNLLHERLSFFQRIKPRGKKEYDWLYNSSKLIKNSGDIYYDRLVLTVPVSDMGEMSSQMGRILDENLYFKKYFKKFSLLTTREKEILPLIAWGFTTVEIAERLFISKETVSQHRKNINTKLEFKTYYELIKFAETFELI